MPTTEQQVSSIKGQLTSLGMQEFFASSPDVGEGVAGMRIARDSEYGILAVYKATDTYNFDDGTGTACLLIDVDGNVILTDAALILNGTLGYIALGNPAPVHTGVGTWTGTGIGIDRAGIVGLASSVTQASFSAATGAITAGVGAVALDVNGISITQGSGNINKIRWLTGSTTVAEISALDVAGQYTLGLNTAATATDGAVIIAARSTSNTAQLNLNALSGNAQLQGTGFSGLIVNAGTSAPSPSSLLHLRSSAPTFRMDDTTASARSMIFTVDANTLTVTNDLTTSLLTLNLTTGALSAAGGVAATGANLVGTANQVSLSASGTGVLLGANNITLSTPQNIHTGATPTFAGLTLSGDATVTASSLGVTIKDPNSVVVGGLLQIQTNGGTGKWRVGLRGQSGSLTDDLYIIADTGSGFVNTLIIANATGNITPKDGANLVLGTTTGTKIGTATSQKLGFWNATPIVQPTTAVGISSFLISAGVTVNDGSTFDGYSIGQVVKALRNCGILA